MLAAVRASAERDDLGRGTRRTRDPRPTHGVDCSFSPTLLPSVAYGGYSMSTGSTVPSPSSNANAPATPSATVPTIICKAKCDEEKTWLRHPLMIVAVTFFLSGILGAIFTQWLAVRDKTAEAERVAFENRKTAVQNLSRFIYERRSRAEMLASSIRRDAPLEEIKDRKRLYDEAYVRWNSNSQANLFLIRDVLQEDEYSFFEYIVESVLTVKILKPLDACLTSAYDHQIAGEDGVAVLDRCNSGMLLTRVMDCGYAITDELYRLSDISGARTKEEAMDEISRRCPTDRGASH